jgi:hypothetical protein
MGCALRARARRPIFVQSGHETEARAPRPVVAVETRQSNLFCQGRDDGLLRFSRPTPKAFRLRRLLPMVDLGHYLPTPTRPTLFSMEAEVVEDKKKATPCECGHPAGLHGLDGVGRCTAAGCGCRGLAVADDEVVAADGSRHAVPVVRFGLRALNGTSPVAGTLGVP